METRYLLAAAGAIGLSVSLAFAVGVALQSQANLPDVVVVPSTPRVASVATIAVPEDDDAMPQSSQPSIAELNQLKAHFERLPSGMKTFCEAQTASLDAQSMAYQEALAAMLTQAVGWGLTVKVAVKAVAQSCKSAGGAP